MRMYRRGKEDKQGFSAKIGEMGLSLARELSGDGFKITGLSVRGEFGFSVFIGYGVHTCNVNSLIYGFTSLTLQ